MSTKAELEEEVKRLVFYKHELEEIILDLRSRMPLTRLEVNEMIEDAISSHKCDKHRREDYR
ncbi:hypothetical protein UFOVP53_138 [uncultured Caudovirales phage]|uniref:Uncharacterized protein n=1 Tax=uncultured Caudovirales phage TaxID=2100421 RepID=A0A6J5KSH8_9CAUD|nr:hypothetical protein UFOVP53_138 [uncultured Caudovirales phage]